VKIFLENKKKKSIFSIIMAKYRVNYTVIFTPALENLVVYWIHTVSFFIYTIY